MERISPVFKEPSGRETHTTIQHAIARTGSARREGGHPSGDGIPQGTGSLRSVQCQLPLVQCRLGRVREELAAGLGTPQGCVGPRISQSFESENYEGEGNI